MLTAYTPITNTATNTASISANTTGVANNAAGLVKFQSQIDAIPASQDLTPYALAADLAAAEGQIAASQSGITALTTSLTTRLAGKANQPALDVLALDVASKSTPASVDTKLQAYSTTGAMNSAIASANNAMLERRQHLRPAERGELIVHRPGRQAIQRGRRPESGDSAAALPQQPRTKIANALLTYVQQVALDAALAIRDGRLDAAEAARTRGPHAGGGSNLINGQAWSGQVTWDLLLGTNTIRNLHASAPLSISLHNDGFTLSLASDTYTLKVRPTPCWRPRLRRAGCSRELRYYTQAAADSAIAAAIASALVPYKTAAQRDAAIAAALAAYSTTAEMNAAIAAAVGAIDLSGFYTIAQTDAAIAAAVGAIDLSAYYTSVQTDAAIAAALAPVTPSEPNTPYLRLTLK